MTKKMLAEFIGTLTLVLFGCGAAVLLPGGDGVDAAARILAISFAFGLAIVAMAYGIGPVSGCHVNPAVSLGAFIAGRMKPDELIAYIIAQVLGAIAGAAILYAVATGVPSFDVAAGMGQNGWGANYAGDAAYGGGYSQNAAFIFEVVMTALFVIVILGATQAGAPGAMAGLAIGLTLAVIHIVGINVTGVSVNPARSLGPAVFVQGKALEQLWLFVAAPLIGAVIAGALFRAKLLVADER